MNNKSHFEKEDERQTFTQTYNLAGDLADNTKPASYDWLTATTWLVATTAKRQLLHIFFTCKMAC